MQDKSYIGVDIGGTTIKAGLIVGKQLVKTHQECTFAEGSIEEVMEQLCKTIKALWNDSVQGIGIGAPGLIDVNEGRIVKINNIPAIEGVSIKQMVAEQFKCPVFLNNDANCFVLGECYFGAGREFNHVLGITLGTGLGGGIVVNKKVYAGLLGAAGEIGCIPYKEGIVEDYTASKFFANKYNSTGFELFNKAEAGDPIAKNAFVELGTNLGQLISTCLFTLAPEAIVIGGSIAKSFKYFEPAIQESLKHFPFELIRDGVKIKHAELSDAGILGAAALCISELE